MLKRILSSFLVVTLVLTAIPMTAFTKTNDILYGDVNVDGEVDLNDALLLRRYIAGENPAGFHLVNADVNVDQEADTTDLLMLKKYLAEWKIHLGAELLTVSFYDGDRLIDALVANKGYALGEVPGTEKTSKADAVFQGWYTDPEFTKVFYADAPVNENTNVYAKYEGLKGSELTVLSFAQTDLNPDAGFRIAGSGDVSSIALITKDGSDPVELSISGNDPYTVTAKGGFKEGASYELTLPEGLCFIGTDGEEMPQTVRTASFTIEKEVVDNLEMREDVHYVKNSAPSNLKEGDKVTIAGVKGGELICFYKNSNPKTREYQSGEAYMDDPEVWFKAGAVDGNTVTLKKLEDADKEKMYDVPDNFPILGALPKGNGGTLTLATDDDGYTLDTVFYKQMVEDVKDANLEYANQKVSVGDFISIYSSEDNIDSEDDIYFGKITAYDAKNGIITYVKSSAEEIEASMDLYIQPVLEGDDLLGKDAKQKLEKQIRQQVMESAFAEEAGSVLAELSARTGSFRRMAKARNLNLSKSFELKDGVEVTVEIVTSGEQLHYRDKGSVQLNIGVDAEFEAEAEDGGKVAIDLSATFVQELAIGVTASGELVKKEILFIPVPIGVKVGSSVDLLSYTGVRADVHAYTVAEEDQPIWEQLKEVAENPKKLADVLPANDKFAAVKKGLETVGDVFDKIDEVKEKIEQVRDDVEKAKEYTEDLQTLWEMVGEMDVDGLPDAEQWETMGKTLGKTNISKDLMDMLELSTETELDAERYADGLDGLLTKYSEMLEKETDWIKLVQKEICQVEINICGFVIYVKADFVVRADMNIAMGANLQYQVGKRYTFWVKIGLFEPTAGSSTMDLVDEQFAFQFYVMGKLGIKMGVEATAGFAIGSADVARVGIHLELGPYVKLYGFFIYEYERLREAKTSAWTSDERMAGALYLDFGLYLIVGVDAAALHDLFEVSYDFIDTEFPLLDAGVEKYPYDFQYEPMEDEMVLVRDEDANSTNGITMMLPEKYRAMKCCDLQTGNLETAVYDWSRYNVTLSNPNFKMDENGVISVEVPENTRYMECDLTLTYKYAKLAFSQYDMQVTIPLVWTNLSTEEIGQYYTASVRVGNATDGYVTVWSKHVRKNQEFTLPTEEEVKELIGYDEMKYRSFNGFEGAGQTTTLIEDKTYDCDVESRPYSITVNGIQNADGSTRTRTFTTRYGEAFDFRALEETGTGGSAFTKYFNVTTTATVTVGKDKDGNPITEVLDLTRPVTGKFAQCLASGQVTATANYVDDSVLVTYTFAGIDVPDYTERIRKGTVSTYDFNKVVAEEGMMVKSISPEQGAAHFAVTYVVACTELVGETYTLSFEEHGGSAVSDIERVGGSLVGTLPTPERKGYTFLGWFTDAGLTTPFTARLMPKKDTVLHAKWKADTYTVTFHVNGGEAWANPEDGTKMITYDGTYGSLPAVKRYGHGFIGWFTAQEGGILISADTKITVTGDRTLYAHWKELKNIPSGVFDFGKAERGTYAKGQTHEVQYEFTPESGEVYRLGDFTFKYMRQGNTEYEAGLPVNAGTYDVLVVRPADNDYEKFEQFYTAVLTIDKAKRSNEDFKNVDLLESAVKRGLNYIEMKIDPDSIVDFSIENTKIVFQAVQKAGNLIIPSEGASGQITAVTEKARIINLLPNTEYAVKFQLVDDPNYYDFTYTGVLPTTIRTLAHDGSELWTDHAEAFTIDETTKSIRIENEQQLAYLAKTVNEGTTYQDYHITLMRDLWMLDYAWTPIGSALKSSFGGVFDGNGYTIHELHTAGSTYAGVFGYVFGDAEIANLTLVESYINGKVQAGAIVGYMGWATVKNCVNESTVVGENSVNHTYGTGGVVGQIVSGTVTNCVNNGRVDGICQTGGIVGKISGGRVTNSVNNGPVKGTNNHTGGVLGYVEGGNVMNSVNNGFVTGVNCVAGVAGQVEEEGSVLNCYTTGTVKGTGTYIGAVVGRNYKNDGMVHQCYYLKGSATCNGSVRNAVGTENGSLSDGDKKTSTAYFTSATSPLSRNADCGTDHLLKVLNNWVEWWNDEQCNAVWETGENGYPMPSGVINTKKGTKQK